jgi:hypothetical protein
MPIRLKILVACIALTGVTLLMGSFSQSAQRDLGEVATRLYDDAFLAMSYLRSAESKLVRAEAEYLPAFGASPHADAQATFATALADARRSPAPVPCRRKARRPRNTWRRRSTASPPCWRCRTATPPC